MSLEPRSQPATRQTVEEPVLPQDPAPRRKDRVVPFGKLLINTADVCIVSAGKHYVRIQTVKNEELIRERFTRVISHLRPTLGFQINRSHWVAFSAVDNVVQSGGKHSVVLKTGVQLPISKARKRSFIEGLQVFKSRQSEF